jgi:hypothetical protein
MSSIRVTQQWRVRWHREGWGPTSTRKSRYFARKGEAIAFANKLAAPYGRLTRAVVTVDVRTAQVGPWEPVT